MHLGIIALLFLTGAASARQQKEPPKQVGKDTCLTCHDMAGAFSRTPHAEAECESCHGPGSAHAEEGGGKTLSFGNKAPSWASVQCLSCHGKDSDLSTFHGAAHGRHDVTCISCHRLHPEKPSFGLLKAEQKELCVTCHQSARADFLKPYRHPVLEGAVKCGDCHTPHSEDRRPMLRMSAGPAEGCVACHSDKKGPFVFEHPAMRVDDCRTCHQPHGSVNAKMLRRSEVHQLCLECHSLTPGVLTGQPPAIHDLRSARYRNCTVCHREIHGSNASPVFVK